MGSGPALRPYQTEDVRRIRHAFASARSVLYQLPTGGGKTVAFAYIAKGAAEKGNRVVVVVHRRELLLQGSRALRELQVPHGIVAPGFPMVKMQTQIASVQTLVRRASKMAPPDLLILDEAHHAVAGSWAKVREAWPKARILGVTATPSRLDGRGLNEVFEVLVVGPSMKSLVDQGYLVPIEVYAPPVRADLSNLHTIGGDFDRGEAAKAVDTPVIVGDAVDHYRRLCNGRRAIAFTATLDHARHTMEAFSAAGIPAGMVDGEMASEERDRVLARFSSGAIRVLTSCQVIEEGFDCPSAEVAILLRPTTSVRVYLQQVGRIMRPAPGKAHGTVLDHVGNTARCGLPDAHREWTLQGRKTKGERAAPMTRCPFCFACFTPGPERCPVCHALLPVKEKEPLAQVDGELEKVSGVDAIQDRMREQAKEERECQSLEDFQALGRARGYKPGWAWIRWNARARRRSYTPSS